MKELKRILKPAGHCTLHFLSVHTLAGKRAYEDECWNHVNNVDTHWHHYYSFDELIVLLSEALEVSDLDVKYYKRSFWVHFSKGTERAFVHDETREASFLRRRDIPEFIRPRNRVS
jgi:hypothetical protein